MLSRRDLSTLLGGLVAASIVVIGATAHVSMSPVRPASDSKAVLVRDSCTPSFNVFFGDPNICQQSDGKVDVFDFLTYLGTHGGTHPLWRFSPGALDLPVGKHIALVNLGGEFHTWTEVANFAGGIIPDLNFGQPIAPECGTAFTLAPESINNVYLDYQDAEDGATAGTPLLPPGTHKFMCCIHPWMQTVVKVNKAGATVASAITPSPAPAHSHTAHHQH